MCFIGSISLAPVHPKGSDNVIVCLKPRSLGRSVFGSQRAFCRSTLLGGLDALFEGREIYTGLRSSDDMIGPLYRQVLGTEFGKLPPQLQALHRVGNGHVWEGKAQVFRGKNVLAKLIAGLVGFPPETVETTVVVTLERDKNGERWVRNFGNKSFTSFQSLGTGRNCCLLVERFGIISVALSVVTNENRLYLVPRRWKILGIPLPKTLLPSGEIFEHEKNGVFWFDVTIKAPLFGLIVAYKGWLKPKPGHA